MSHAACIDVRLQLRAIGLCVLLALLSGCGDGSTPATQPHTTTASDVPVNFPPPQSTPPRRLTPTFSAQAPAIVLSRVIGNSGATVVVDATLMSAGAQVAALQADIGFPPDARVAARPNGRPDCSVNPDIDKNASSFAFLPSSCTNAGCTGLCALVLATDNISPIANGSLLFSCAVQIDPDAAPTLTLTAMQVIMSDPVGSRIDGTGIDGVITIEDAPVPTRVPTAAPSATVAVGGPAVVMGNVTARPGATVDISATLSTQGAAIASVQLDVDFAPQARIFAKANGKPWCFVNPDIDKGATSFAFRPPGCLGTDCTAFRALVTSSDNVSPIPDGSVLITCRVNIAGDALGTFPLVVHDVLMADPNHTGYHGGSPALGVAGSITVSGTPIPTETPTVLPDSPPAATPTLAVDSVTRPSIVLSPVSAVAGSAVTFTATLALPHNEVVAATQNDISFPPGVRVSASTDGKPDCQANPDIGKDATSSVFQPPFCTGVACTGMRMLVLSLASSEAVRQPIPNGAVLYTCQLEIAPTATGTFALPITGVVMSDPDGNQVPGADAVDGVVTVTAP